MSENYGIRMDYDLVPGIFGHCDHKGCVFPASCVIIFDYWRFERSRRMTCWQHFVQDSMPFSMEYEEASALISYWDRERKPWYCQQRAQPLAEKNNPDTKYITHAADKRWPSAPDHILTMCGESVKNSEATSSLPSCDTCLKVMMASRLSERRSVIFPKVITPRPIPGIPAPMPANMQHTGAFVLWKGFGKKKIRKSQRNRPAGWHGNHPDQKPRKRYTRDTIDALPMWSGSSRHNPEDNVAVKLDDMIAEHLARENENFGTIRSASGEIINGEAT